ncbi:MAG: hypothetical protein IT522_17375 [Burkholderiales bacterium]|nr:hypothetical protein [Burkholderiales bacterium]
MTDFTTELRHAAEADVAVAREAALRARTIHSRAELMRHMMLTTAKSTDRPRGESVRLVTDEWLDAWRRDRTNYPYVALMEALSGACYDALTTPDAATDRAVRAAFAALERACVDHGTTLADEMAWRSGCSHEWWGDVLPAPDAPEYREQAKRRAVLWQRGCPPECLG